MSVTQICMQVYVFVRNPKGSRCSACGKAQSYLERTWKNHKTVRIWTLLSLELSQKTQGAPEVLTLTDLRLTVSKGLEWISVDLHFCQWPLAKGHQEYTSSQRNLGLLAHCIRGKCTTCGTVAAFTSPPLTSCLCKTNTPPRICEMLHGGSVSSLRLLLYILR